MPGVSLLPSRNSIAFNRIYKQTALGLHVFPASQTALSDQASHGGATARKHMGSALTYSAAGCYALGYCFSAGLCQMFFPLSFVDIR